MLSQEESILSKLKSLLPEYLKVSEDSDDIYRLSCYKLFFDNYEVGYFKWDVNFKVYYWAESLFTENYDETNHSSSINKIKNKIERFIVANNPENTDVIEDNYDVGEVKFINLSCRNDDNSFIDNKNLKCFNSNDYIKHFGQFKTRMLVFNGDFEKITLENLNGIDFSFSNLRCKELSIKNCIFKTLNVRDCEIKNMVIDFSYIKTIGFIDNKIYTLKLTKTTSQYYASFSNNVLGGTISWGIFNVFHFIKNKTKLNFENTNFVESSFKLNEFNKRDNNVAFFTLCNLHGVLFQENKYENEPINNFKDYFIFSKCNGISTTVPTEGSFIAWKIILGVNRTDYLICKLLIPEDAKRISTPSRKCRSDKAVVLSIETLDGIIVTAGRSSFNPKFIYKVGQTIKSDSYNDSSTCGCGNGINFFMSREDALDYIKFL